MEFGDFLWAVLMFIVGLVTFRVTSLKRFLDVVGVIVSVLSLFFIATKSELLVGYFFQIPVSYIGGTITHYFYLIGANIGRADQFGDDINWGRIILYGIAILVLILLLRWLNPMLVTQSIP
jgi:hypothetical protein